MRKNTDNIFRKIMAFSLPYMLSCFMQTLYGMADLFITGQFDGVESITAVSVGSQVMHMITVMIVGMAMGTTVLIGKSVGAGDRKLTAKAIGNTVTLFAIFAAVITISVMFATNAIVSLMSTPKEAITETVSYLKICFAGIPFITAYNIISSIFRGKGDSKTPMYFVAVACITNIILDYVFIGAFDMGAAGAALGTTLSQAVSVVFSLISVAKRNTEISFKRKDLSPSKDIMTEIVKVGLPVALQDGLIQISFLLITMFANLRGLEDAAAVGIVEKIISVLFLVPSAMLSTVSALSAQFIGAKRLDYAQKTLRYALILSVVFGFISVTVMQIAAESVVRLFSDDMTVVVMGGQYMRGYVWDCILAGIHFCFSGYFCTCKLSGISFTHNCISIFLMRVPLAYVTAKYCTQSLFPMGLATTAGSCVSVLICVIAYFFIKRSNRANT